MTIVATKNIGDWNDHEAVLKAAKRATGIRYECLHQKRDFVFETRTSKPS